MASPQNHVMASSCDSMQEKALETIEYLIEARSRRFALRPHQLESIADGLSKLSPLAMSSVLDDMLGSVSMPKIFGGETCLISLLAAQRYASRLVAIENGNRVFHKSGVVQ